jgi:hypothetical protein
MKTVVLVAPHFFPSFLPAVHRARLWAYHLQEFGWNPVIVTTDPKYYECQLDDELMKLLPEDLEVVRTRALPTRPVRIIGNLGFRSVWWYYKAVRKLARERRVDFVHITCDSFPSALAGPAIERFLGIPYGIDYQDPWIPETPVARRFLSKGWLAQRVSAILEPIAVRRARLITGINEKYFASVLLRNPQLEQRAETAGMPFGSSERDFALLAERPRKPFLFDPADGKLHVLYAGALLPQAHGVLERLFHALQILRAGSPDLADRLRIHFVGTGMHESDPARGHTVTPYIEKWKLAGMVDEMPSRIRYLDVLTHLAASHAVLVIGSTERHYSPSKIYQGVLSRRPVFALLHEESTALAVLRGSNAGVAVGFREDALPDSARLAQQLETFLRSSAYDADAVNWSAFDKESARESTRLLAEAMDRALDRERRERGSGAARQ